jgi:phage terminase large subunit
LSKVKTRDDADFYITTYKDNPFLDPELIHEIELMQKSDATLWSIYGLGQTATIKGLIYPNITIGQFDFVPAFYGMDFGYTNDPSTVIGMKIVDKTKLFIDEYVYRTGLLNNDLSALMAAGGIKKRSESIFADSAEPKSIDELCRMGWNVKHAKKGKDSIINGINRVKQFELFVTERSVNVIKEFRNYKYEEDKNGIVLNTPVDAFNHAMDPIRYGVDGVQTVRTSVVKKWKIS